MLATRMRMAAAGATGTPAAGWWVVAGQTCVAAYQPIGAASLAASYVNLANPGTYDAAPGVAPTWDAGTGWTGGGGACLTTGVVPVTGYSMIVRSSDGSGNQCVAGIGSEPWFMIEPLGNGSVRWGIGATSAYSGTASQPSVLAIAGNAVYQNGLPVTTVGTGTITNSGNYAIDLLRRGGLIIDRYWRGSIQAVAIYSDTLSGAEVATLSAAMAALT